MFDAKNLKMGAAAALATMIALNLTSGQSKLVQGAAAVLASMGGLYAATKF